MTFSYLSEVPPMVSNIYVQQKLFTDKGNNTRRIWYLWFMSFVYFEALESRLFTPLEVRLFWTLRGSYIVNFERFVCD